MSGKIHLADLVKRFYLPNKLEVLIISSSDSLTSSVSFGLDLGSTFDPKDYLGLSKILSCVSQYIQTEGKEFTKVVDSIQKKTQACITYYWIPQSSDTTIEFSGIFSSACLDEYLGRIRSSLDVSDYSEEIITNCLGMLRREYENEVNSSTVKRNAVIKSIFHSGLRGSLLMTKKNDLVSDLITEIKRFKKKYFSSNIMKLVIESSLSLEYLVKLANKHFSTIPNLEIDIKGMRHNIGVKNVHTENLLGSLVQYKGVDNKISFIFVLDSKKGAILGSNRIPLFEYLVKHYFCGEFSGSLRNALFPLILTCSVEYYAERLAFVWLEVESEGGQIPLEETLELIYSSVVLLRKTKIEKKYFEFLINHCIANYMNFNWFDYKLNFQDRISSLINYNVWHKLERYCKYNDLKLEEFNQILTFLDIENLLVLVNSNQVNYLMSSNYDDYEDCIENVTEIVENQTTNTSSYSFSSNSGSDDHFGKSCKNRIVDYDEKYAYHYIEPLFKIKYNIRKISPRLVKRLKGTKESFGIINGLSRPFINPYTPKDFKLFDFTRGSFSSSQILENNMDVIKSNSFTENYSESYPPKYLFSGIEDVFKNKMIQDRHLAIGKNHDTQISISENVKIWYKARNDNKQPYFKGMLRLSSPFNSFTLINLILSFILVISMKSVLNLPLIQDAKLSLIPRNGSEHSSNFPSLDFHINGYSSSLYPILKTISSSLNSQEIISEAIFYDSLLTYKGLLMSRKQSMTSELKAKELSWRITVPNYPTLGRQFLGLSRTTHHQLYNEFKKFKENLCIDGLFIGNLDRDKFEKSLKNFSTKFGFKATKEQCLKLFKSRSFPIKDVRGTPYKRMIYHYIRPGPFDLSNTCCNSDLQQKGTTKFNPKLSIENLFKLLNEECGQINCTNETIRSGYLDFKSGSNEFGPNIALLDIIIYKNTQGFKTYNVDIEILYLNDAYYNIMWLKESLSVTNASLSLKTSIERFDSYYKWSIQLESWEYSANDLGLYISKFTDQYQNNLKGNFGEEYKVIKNLTISKLKNRLMRTDIDEEFNSHKFNLGYSESVIDNLQKIDFYNFTSKMSNILRDNALFLLVQVQSAPLKDLILTRKSQNFKSKSRNPCSLELAKNNMISIPSGYKYIKHIDELIQDDRIPTNVSDSDE
ncbi:insulinase like peptidase [Cryptosporidium sp. chipmunk genotype I]|uniref:insulinase like peptidase n=1 Tax=Cryptosporidium sp. chipmunk genotype I TaxID=1280935 RepID=UPI00351A1E0F|nr:insulinase like peptidase [Cryptosporidium sp. chipmunk genotype I]